ncbi:F-box domain, Leucine-rich repeat domain, L domain-like protein [Artemisia annua]|uniref:F-box domain, Leucine-rich repeat domain, L domain-like protein n=1 Tax=Artemisia annua TaxID=35608 RepID=A0A2U1QC33_ARTAN|nr:F-box domain, Leucine-rich repeat domain, L domain-like protein [Artemisia annua]
MAKKVIDTTDRISELPDYLVHHVLSFLESPIDLVRTSVLSKKWFELTASFPIMNFTQYVFERAIHASRTSYNTRNVTATFYKYMAYTVSRFCEQEDVSAHTFKLMTGYSEPTEVDIIEKCLESVLNKGVKVLDINCFNPLGPVCCLPNILLSVTSLTSLTVSNCKLPSSLMVDVVKFKSLKLLELRRVTIDEGVIKCLTASCPLIKTLKLSHCLGLKRFSVSGLQSLEYVRFYYNHGVERIDIDVPNLHVCAIFVQGPPCINLGSCRKLRRLTYHGYPFPTSKSFTDFLSSLPVLRMLTLSIPDQYNTLKLSSLSLRYLEIHTECDLEMIDINTPNLRLFRYIDKFADLESDFPESKASMECYPMNNTLWFQKLKRFLDKTNRFKFLKLHLPKDFSIDVDQPRVIQSPTYDLDHVELNIRLLDNLSVYEAFVDAILWCCRPQSLTLTSDFSAISFEERTRVVEFTYKKLLQQEAQGKTNIQFSLSSLTNPK